MKKLFIITAMVVSIGCNEQKKVAATDEFNLIFKPGKGGDGKPGELIFRTTEKDSAVYQTSFSDTAKAIVSGKGAEWIRPKQDTVKVLLLLCDTSFLKGGMTSALTVLDGDDFNDRRNIYEIKSRVPHVWWQFGYEYVRGGNFPVIYLDENKKRLPDNIVVWMTKQYPILISISGSNQP